MDDVMDYIGLANIYEKKEAVPPNETASTLKKTYNKANTYKTTLNSNLNTFFFPTISLTLLADIVS